MSKYKREALMWMEIVENNLSMLASKSVGLWVDPSKRPKNQRLTWTADSYKKGIQKRLEYLRNEGNWEWKWQNLRNVPYWVSEVINNWNVPSRLRDIWNTMHMEYFDPEIDVKLAIERKKVRESNKDAKERELKCPKSMLFIYYRASDTGSTFNDGRNRRKKEDVCQCHSCQIDRACQEVVIKSNKDKAIRDKERDKYMTIQKKSVKESVAPIGI